MKILNIKLFNYGSFVGEHFISLVDKGLVLIQGINKDETKMDSNGAGKSHIPDSLDWCINGKVPREDNADSVINDNCKECFVEVQIESDNGDMILIKRSKKRGESTVLKLLLNDDVLTKLDVKETQKEIYHLLGIDRDIFHSTVLFAQNDLVHYADSNDSKRMEVLTKLLQLEFIDDLLVIVKRKQNELSCSEQNILGKKQSIESILGDLKNKNWNQVIDEWENTRDNAVNSLSFKIESLNSDYNSIKVEDSKPYIDKIDSLNTELSKVTYPNEINYRNISRKISSLDSELAVSTNELNRLEKEILDIENKLQNGSYYCDKCGQIVTVDHINSELLNLQSSKNSLLLRHDEILHNRFYMVDQFKNEENKLSIEKDAISTKMVYLNADIKKYRDIISSIEDLTRKKKSILDAISLLSRGLEEEKSKINPWLVARDNSIKDIIKYEEELLNLTQQLESVYTLKECYSFWISAFGSKGLKSYILDTKLQELNDAINYWINLLTDGTLWVQLGSYKKGRSANKVINSPDVRVCRWASDGSIISRNYKSWSGGEKQRVSLAIDFGLSSIISSRSSKKYNLIILDEVFKHLDRGGKESVMEMLKLLATEKESLFVIEHDSDFQSLFENKITVIKEKGASRFMEEDYEHKKCDEKTTSLLFGRRVVKRTAIRNTF